MWKRDEVVRPPADSADVEEHPLAGLASAGGPRRASDKERPVSRDVVNIGKSVIIKGELSGSENLTIEGQFEGKIDLRDNALTVGPNGKIKADLLFAKSVDILGRVTGKITAVDIVSIRENGAVDGDITAPRIAIADGAHFRGSVDMRRDGAEPKPKEAAAAKAPAPAKTPAPQPSQSNAPAARVGRPTGGRQGR